MEHSVHILDGFLLHLSSLLDYIVLILLQKIQKRGHYLPVVSIVCVFLELSEHDPEWHYHFGESNHLRIGSVVDSQLVNQLADNSILDLSCLRVLFGKLKRNQRVWHRFVLQRLGLRVQELRCRVERVKQILSNRHELVGLLIYQS